MLDAADARRRFGTPPELVQAIIAGGNEAIYRAVEASEDDAAAGVIDLEKRGVTVSDAWWASPLGHTPYTVPARSDNARSIGAFTVASPHPGFSISRAAR